MSQTQKTDPPFSSREYDLSIKTWHPSGQTEVFFLVKPVDESWRETAGYFCCGLAMRGHSPVPGRSSNTVYPVSPVVSAVEEI